MKKYILVAIELTQDGCILNIKRVYSGSEKECELYRNIIIKERQNNHKHIYYGWELHIV